MDNNELLRKSRIFNESSYAIVFTVFALLFSCSASLQAKPMGPIDAEKLVRGWLKHNIEPLGKQMGRYIKETEVYADAAGQTTYYIIYLQREGFVVVPADDQVEPIIAFVARGNYDPSPDNPLGALVSSDVPARVAMVRRPATDRKLDLQKSDKGRQQSALQESIIKARNKWAKFRGHDDEAGITGISGVSDIRAGPLVQSEWDQGSLQVDTGGGYEFWPLYDYYTPNEYLCGCVATAMAQLMRYHEHPVAAVGTPSFEIYVDGSPQMASLRGGDGSGGPYSWSEMMLEPNSSITEAQRQAIGALCYDAGVAIETSYTPFASSAPIHNVSSAFTQTFMYGNAIYGNRGTWNIGAGLNAMVNPNLDAGLPVLLAIRHSTSGGNHAIVCDGYGYDNMTLYHHLNMGWRGYDNAWYALPQIDSSPSFDIVYGCVYNIFTSGSGEVVSGRVTDSQGTPVNDAIVTAQTWGGGTYLASTNANGIYALTNLPSNTSFCVTASRCGWQFDSQNVLTGLSIASSSVSGNIWEVDFSGAVSDGFVELERQAYLTGEVVTVRVVDADLQGIGTKTIALTVCSADAETMILTEFPTDSGILSADIPTLEGTVTTEDGVIQATGTQTLIAVYQDSNDGSGNPITRRDVATVATAQTTIYETDFTGGLPAGWTIINGFDDENTWNSENPGGQYSPYWSGTFMIVDCQHPFAIGFDEELITHSIDCSMYERVTLAFNHHFYHGGSETASIGVRANGGDWQNVARYQVASAYGLEEIDISPVAAGRANVQVRWHYYEEGVGDYWGIDDVKVSGVVPLVGIPGDFEPDCDVDWADAAVLADEWLTAGGQADIFPADGGDGTVNMFDLAVIGQTWMVGVH
jgi:hypothetical protein